MRKKPAKSKRILHFCGGASQPKAKNNIIAVYIAKIAMAMRGFDVNKLPNIVFRHCDKPGRSDYHVLVGRDKVLG